MTSATDKLEFAVREARSFKVNRPFRWWSSSITNSESTWLSRMIVIALAKDIPKVAVNGVVNIISFTVMKSVCACIKRSSPKKPRTCSLAGLRKISSGVSYWIKSPSCHTAIRSAKFKASSISWVTNTKVEPNSTCSSLTNSCNASRVIGSKAPNGSSIKTIFGLAAKARITPIRCCCPPDNSLG